MGCDGSKLVAVDPNQRVGSPNVDGGLERVVVGCEFTIEEEPGPSGWLKLRG